MPETAEGARKLAKPVDYDDLYPGRFLKAADFKGKKVTLTVKDVNIEELEGEGGKKIKATLAFNETEKQLVACKTNGLCLKAMFGRVLAEWVGKRVTLFPDTWNNEPCIRVWGSPDIKQESEVDIALPRRRPFKKTMHRMLPRGAGADAPAAPTASAAIARLKAATTLAALASEKQSVWALYAGAHEEIPLDVEATYQDHKEHLEQQS
jgi:hypothetical protein